MPCTRTEPTQGLDGLVCQVELLLRLKLQSHGPVELVLGLLEVAFRRCLRTLASASCFMANSWRSVGAMFWCVWRVRPAAIPSKCALSSEESAKEASIRRHFSRAAFCLLSCVRFHWLSLPFQSVGASSLTSMYSSCSSLTWRNASWNSCVRLRLAAVRRSRAWSP